MDRKYFSLVVVLALLTSFAADDCISAIAPAIIASSGDGLRGSSDKGAQAAGNSAAAVDTVKSREELEGKALSSSNLRMADKMDFGSIDSLIKTYGYEDKYYLQKAAMLVAAGKDDAEVRQNQGKALDSLKKKNSSGNDEEALYRYLGELGNVQTGLVKGSPAWTRVHNEFCAQRSLYTKTFPNPGHYSYYTATLINVAVSDGPC